MNFYTFLDNRKALVLYFIVYYVIIGVIGYCNRDNDAWQSKLITFSVFFNISRLDMPAKSLRQILYVGGLLSSLALMLAFQWNYTSLSMAPIYWKYPHTIAELTGRNFQLSGEATVLATLKANKVVKIMQI